MRVIAYQNSGINDKEVTLDIRKPICIAKGTFGEIFKTNIALVTLNNGSSDTTEKTVAIKKVKKESRNSHRELVIVKKLSHPNLISLNYYYYSTENDVPYLNMIFEYVPHTLFTIYTSSLKQNAFVPKIFIKLFRGLAFLHSRNIAHRDIKPHNLLINSPGNLLKICDFGSAKYLDDGDPNIAYICSRYYRAPELAFGSRSYTCSVDIWSCGCVLAELILGRPLFLAENSLELICEMAKLLGTPTKADILKLNKAFCVYEFPQIFPYREHASLIPLLQRLLVFSPLERIEAKNALFHETFVELIQQSAIKKINGSCEIPCLVDFTEEGIS